MVKTILSPLTFYTDFIYILQQIHKLRRLDSIWLIAPRLTMKKKKHKKGRKETLLFKTLEIQLFIKYIQVKT